MRAKRRSAWTLLNLRMRGLPQVAFNHAMAHEPHSGAPGLDIDAIYRRYNSTGSLRRACGVGAGRNDPPLPVKRRCESVLPT
jgi:hypothetical protein